MKRIGILLYFVMTILLVADTIRITTNEYEPYVMINNRGEHSGVIIDIVRTAFQKEGITVKFENYPFTRATLMVQNGEAEATIPKFKTEKRLKEFLFSDGIIQSKAMFFYLKNSKIPENLKWDKIEDLKTYRIGATLGYWYIERFEKAGIKVDIASSNENNLKKLYLGRIDLFVIDEITGWSLIKKIYPGEQDKFGVLSKEESSENLFIMFSKTNPNSQLYIQKFNLGLDKIKKSGEYKKIIERYFKNRGM